MIATEPAAGTLAVVTGWGASDNTTLTSQLQAVELSIAVRTACVNAHARNRTITANMVCAGVAGKGICNGDFGGPLFAGGKLAGIASWATGCADAQHPGVYTSVAKLKGFVTQVTGVQ